MSELDQVGEALQSISGYKAGGIYTTEGEMCWDDGIQLTQSQAINLRECFFHQEPFMIGGKKFTVFKSSMNSVCARSQTIVACIFRTGNLYIMVMGLPNVPASQIISGLETIVQALE
jgi:hypothetical protein